MQQASFMLTIGIYFEVGENHGGHVRGSLMNSPSPMIRLCSRMLCLPAPLAAGMFGERRGRIGIELESVVTLPAALISMCGAIVDTHYR
jgi:hypothetical protein